MWWTLVEPSVSHDMAGRTLTFTGSDGPGKVTGIGTYTADLTAAGVLVAKFRYAEATHARILELDTSGARVLPGELAVLAHEDVPDVMWSTAGAMGIAVVGVAAQACGRRVDRCTGEPGYRCGVRVMSTALVPSVDRFDYPIV